MNNSEMLCHILHVSLPLFSCLLNKLLLAISFSMPGVTQCRPYISNRLNSLVLKYTTLILVVHALLTNISRVRLKEQKLDRK
jgi:hypothetical protein